MQARLDFYKASPDAAKALIDLTLAIGALNAWNRLAISFRKMPPA